MNSSNQLRIISFNIHKGFGPASIRFTLPLIKEFLKREDADIVFLQEAVGNHTGKKIVIPDYHSNNQVKYLAEDLYPHTLYGANKIHKLGDHGNAILSRYPLELVNNHDISQNRFESRGLLHAKVIDGLCQEVHLFNTHLNLLERDRQKQLQWITEHLDTEIEKHHPVILAGDFNDWRKKAVAHIEERALLTEVFGSSMDSKYPKSFPSFLPGLSLDRMFYMNLNLIEAMHFSGKDFRNLSDHLPIQAFFEI